MGFLKGVLVTRFLKLARILEYAHLRIQERIPPKMGVLDISIKNLEAMTRRKKLVELVFVIAKKAMAQ